MNEEEDLDSAVVLEDDVDLGKVLGDALDACALLSDDVPEEEEMDEGEGRGGRWRGVDGGDG